MTPYYERNGIVIYHADCREVLPELTGVDVVLTDPPYGFEGGSGNSNTKRGKASYRSVFEDNGEYIRSVVVPVIQSLIDTVSCVVVTPGNRYFAYYPPPQSFGAFYQPASMGLQVFGNADAQPILYYGKNALGRNMGVPCSYVLTEAPERSIHPCPKPPKAWQRLLSNISKPGHLVFDPFMGVGTTLRAAKNLGLRAIGAELDEKYCEEAANRLAQEVFTFEVEAA